MSTLVQRYLNLDLPLGQSCFLWGARKTGKSMYLRQQYPNMTYIDFLKADIFRAYTHEPQRLRHEINAGAMTHTIILDEIQKIPPLLDEVHSLIESHPMYQFILCGSSARRLKSTGANLLGGRAWRHFFVPFCYAELRQLDWRRIFNHGLIPSHYLSDHPQRYLEAYIYDYILPEVHIEANLRNREVFVRFLDIFAFSHGDIINYTNIARDCGVSSKTIRSYFEILEDMYLGYFVYPCRAKSNRQTIQEMPKFYFFDVGIANYLRRYTYDRMAGAEAGKSFEHYVLLELMAYKLLSGKRNNIMYWRTKDGHEVDFIVGNQAFEVKISTPLHKRDLKGLVLYGSEQGASLNVIGLEPHKRRMTVDGQDILIWPVEEFLQALWNHEVWQE